ncbi:MarR family winged helix-turn-helix transcriptional regulator [Paralcaligenes sp. KSB-10]|uniref:MarR family winged helix-turn-helix transcriptional regulator n=1 Tax=Paralcaligenes sp. KSB-10 TaxID=2901142 RepID=UPI001E5A7405|nr:MarR family winged helix-turn-helix transcriptional regulator [Paralcaligenes sp. KSB-10]UHL63264.1 MarR family winged helix-turn-helix transcriptional regulator [Paralcaligenes sp. KSB-10]
MKSETQEQESPDSGPSAYRGHSTFLPYVLNRTTSAVNADFQMVLREQGLTLIHWRVLAFLRDADGLGVSALANVTGTDQATLSRALTVMEKAGYIARDSDPMDQRVVVIKLCPAGKKQFAKILPVAWELHTRAIAGFSPEEQHVLNQLLNRICDNVLA